MRITTNETSIPTLNDIPTGTGKPVTLSITTARQKMWN